MIRILIAGLLGGLAMYVWSSVAHVATPLGMTGIQTIANEAAVTGPMKANLTGHPGLYLFPKAAEHGAGVPGPAGFLIYRDNVTGMSAKTLGSEFAVELLEGLIAAALLSVTALAGYLQRVAFVGGVGVAAAIATDPSYWIWYRFPANFTAAAMLVTVVGYVVAGLVIAAILKPRAAASA